MFCNYGILQIAFVCARHSTGVEGCEHGMYANMWWNHFHFYRMSPPQTNEFLDYFDHETVSWGTKAVMTSRSRASNSIWSSTTRRGVKCDLRWGESVAGEPRAASRESNLKIEFKLCGKAARARRHVLEINLISFFCFRFLFTSPHSRMLHFRLHSCVLCRRV